MNISDVSNDVVEEIGLVLRSHVSKNTSPRVMSRVDGVPDGVVSSVGGVPGGAMSSVDGVGDMPNNMVPEIFLIIDQTVLRVSENLSPNVTDPIGVKNAITGHANRIRHVWGKIFRDAQDGLINDEKDFWHHIVRHVTNAVNTAHRAARNAANAAHHAVRNAVNTAHHTWRSIFRA